MSLHDEWSLINIIMLLGCIFHTALHLEHARARPLCVCVVGGWVLLPSFHSEFSEFLHPPNSETAFHLAQCINVLTQFPVDQ